MKENLKEPMFIYISGPYAPGDEEKDKNKRAEIIKKNIHEANQIALDITRKGHYPFVPHTMMQGWEDIYGVSRDLVINNCKQWIKKCDALYFIASSAGADMERRLAEKLELDIYDSLDQIPEATTDINPCFKLSQQAFDAYLTEYRECAESYRHTYQTIWQAGTLFIAISAGLIALSSNISNITGLSEIIPVIVPVPIILWFLGCFIPMDRYGELRRDRLREIEEELNKLPGLKMRHFLKFRAISKDTKKLGRLKSLFKLKWSVKIIIRLFGLFVIMIEIFLLIRLVFKI